ncbi:hypothetical protein BIZ71_gp17 [Gordonia phage Hedwig]|uniref:Tail assembly chaperone n=1 Tax=Gordonia phage Hedwig TaxID=1887648 RepID=A0A1C9EHU2_9CAUD|nr:hypothetical protein BIZ71_gp17 [Gordonia phage Hedwig]AON97310.1 hypothetical protein SEA_HEDWIG_17 [Gordonia phage Hedwig]QOC55879.1 hypothetical protein SEA_DIRTYBOI_17 [Gordonia phage DirtyBoi]
MTTQTGNRAQRRATPTKAAAKRTAKKAPPKPAAAAALDEQARPSSAIDESRAREVDGVTLVPFDFRGDTYWFPRDVEDWDLRAMRAFEDDKALTALEYLFADDENGKSGYDLLMSRGYRLGDVEELFELVADVGGFSEA